MSDSVALDKVLSREPADAIVLEVMIPQDDGLAICPRLRAAGDEAPVLMFTAKGKPIDRIVGLEMGEDDYLGKPFLPRELVARLTAILRRTQGRVGGQSGKRIAFGPFVLDLAAIIVTREGTPIILSSCDYALLVALAPSTRRPLPVPN